MYVLSAISCFDIFKRFALDKEKQSRPMLREISTSAPLKCQKRNETKIELFLKPHGDSRRLTVHRSLKLRRNSATSTKNI